MRIQRIQAQQEIASSDSEIDVSLMNPLLEKYKNKKGNLIPLLQGTQEMFGYIPEEAFLKLEAETGHKLSLMYGVATFYAQFRLAPVGKHIIKVCHGTACHVQNAKALTTALKEALKTEDGGTTDDGLFTLESVACLGCCSLAPVMMIGDETYGKLDGKSSVKIVKQIRREENKK